MLFNLFHVELFVLYSVKLFMNYSNQYSSDTARNNKVLGNTVLDILRSQNCSQDVLGLNYE